MLFAVEKIKFNDSTYSSSNSPTLQEKRLDQWQTILLYTFC